MYGIVDIRIVALVAARLTARHAWIPAHRTEVPLALDGRSVRSVEPVETDP